MKHLRPLLLLAIVLTAPAFAAAPSTSSPIDPSPDTAVPGSIDAIAKYTTETRYLSPWVAYEPASTTVPSPSQALGHVIGAAGVLTHSGQIVEYVRRLAATSPRVHVET